mgnify:CR=1 FL=1
MVANVFVHWPAFADLSISMPLEMALDEDASRTHHGGILDKLS